MTRPSYLDPDARRCKRCGTRLPAGDTCDCPVPLWPPIAGYYGTKLVKNGPRVAVRIWFGQAIIDGEEQDRTPGWFVEIDAKTDRIEKDEDTGYLCRVPLDVERAWPHCAKDPITEAEYRYLVAHAEWAREHAPDHPKANPRKAVDFNTVRLPF